MREYHLYVRDNRQYEVVPVGFSWGAFLLGPIWAAIYALLLRYLLIMAIGMVPIVMSELLDGRGSDVAALVGSACLNAGHIYFCFRAFEWRGSLLCSSGYEDVASISARSSKHALEKWSRSDNARRYLGDVA
jgi:hypothetical protein